jgi:ribosome biogenesis protein ENP2
MQEVNGIAIYDLTAGKTETQFIDEARKTGKSLRYNQEFRDRFEMIQDFEFATVSTDVQVTAS